MVLDELWDEEDDDLVGDFNCWSCRKPVTYEAHMHNDGFCPHCNVEIELDEEDE